MAFPEDLSDVAAFKVHPAIGVARLANNDDHYEFFDYRAKRLAGEAAALEYMSVNGGQRRMKRQAVQFKVFAYNAAGAELGELTGDVRAQLGLEESWTATVANRKLNNWSGGATPIVLATATARGTDEIDLEGDNPWHPTKVWLGTLTGGGTFLPPKGGVYRQDENKEIPPYGAHEQDNGVLDTTCDGSISVNLGDIGDRPVVPACIIVAPQDHSPDVKAAQLGGHNKDFVMATRRLLGIDANAQLVGEGYAMDIAMMDTMNADYNPGMEISVKATDALPVPKDAFYPRGQGPIDAHEIRPRYDSLHANHGALTAGLCSTWQTDLNACLNWWTAEYPNMLEFEANPSERFLARAQFAAAGPQMNHPEMLNTYIDMMGVGRDEQGDPFALLERERTAADNAGAQPQAPFPIEPPR